jgi:hypothetical protein
MATDQGQSDSNSSLEGIPVSELLKIKFCAIYIEKWRDDLVSPDCVK